jgi:hypothetical protein
MSTVFLVVAIVVSALVLTFWRGELRNWRLERRRTQRAGN